MLANAKPHVAASVSPSPIHSFSHLALLFLLSLAHFLFHCIVFARLQSPPATYPGGGLRASVISGRLSFHSCSTRFLKAPNSGCFDDRNTPSSSSGSIEKRKCSCESQSWHPLKIVWLWNESSVCYCQHSLISYAANFLFECCPLAHVVNWLVSRLEFRLENNLARHIFPS